MDSILLGHNDARVEVLRLSEHTSQQVNRANRIAVGQHGRPDICQKRFPLGKSIQPVKEIHRLLFTQTVNDLGKRLRGYAYRFHFVTALLIRAPGLSQ